MMNVIMKCRDTFYASMVVRLRPLGLPRLCLNIYIVDVLCNLNKDTEEQLLRPTREGTAVVIGLLYVAPMLILHLWDILTLDSSADM